MVFPLACRGKLNFNFVEFYSEKYYTHTHIYMYVYIKVEACLKIRIVDLEDLQGIYNGSKAVSLKGIIWNEMVTTFNMSFWEN